MSNDQSTTAAGDEATKAKDPFITTTLAERGPVLPIGVLQPDGGVNRSLEVRPWRMKEERELGALKQQAGEEGGTLANYISMVLGYMCPQIGGNRFETNQVTMAQVKIGQMYMADVFHAYCWLRLQALGHELPFKLKSPNTNKEFEWTADLRTLEVRTIENPEDMYWTYNVKVPFQIRGKTISKMIMGQQFWSSLGMMEPGGNMGAATASIIAASVHRIPELQEGPVALVDGDLDEMTKRDIEAISTAIDDHGLGPKMYLEVTDPTVPRANKPTFKAPLDWRYDAFFQTSSPS